jgi:hypothetical protein
VQCDGFIVVGYELSAVVSGVIPSFLLAAERKGGLISLGGVGTDFKRTQAIALCRQLVAIRTPEKSSRSIHCPSSLSNTDYMGLHHPFWGAILILGCSKWSGSRALPARVERPFTSSVLELDPDRRMIA